MRKKRETPIEKIARAASESVFEEIISSFEDNPKGATPIERIFFAAFSAHMRYVVCSSDYDLWYLRDGETVQERMRRLDGDRYDITIGVSPVWVGCQTELGAYRADFTFSVESWRDGKWRTLVVECDGHDFHERTKAQAAHDRSRDRWMIQQGYSVFRFTGSELYRDPMKCAEQVWDMLNKLASTDGG